LISGTQHGFLSRRSTTTCQLDFFEFVSSAYDAGRSIVLVYLDISKAFDRVPHRALLLCLSEAGITGQLHRWFTSYLTNRNQVTRVSGSTSKPTPITSGVVQGSVLGPILFLLYINTALSYVTHGTPFLFADDVKLAYSFPRTDFSTTIKHVQEDLNSLSNWSQASGLSFSTTKSLFLTFRCPVNMPSLLLGNSQLRPALEVCDLGIRYSCTFNFSLQAHYQAAKARKICHHILRSFQVREVKVALYKLHVRPILEYCTMISTYYSAADRRSLEGVQRMFTKRLLPAEPYQNYRMRCKHLKLTPLWLRRLSINLALLHRLIYATAHTVQLRPSLIHSTYTLRNAEQKLHCDKARTTFRHLFFLNFYSRAWNQLPVKIRSIKNPFVFKRSLQT
jgi:hypothetical protein